PIDLWLQVISVKLLGFSSTTLKLPEALAGTASVPLLYVTVRRMWSAPAGIAAAAAMAVLPIEVITARSDTMDGVMMLTLVLALLAAVHAVQSGRGVWLLATAAMLGVAFNVKLLESLVALPGIAVFAYLGLPGPRKRRLLRLSATAIVYTLVALSWLTATLLFPAHERPYAIGSTNGSAWNAAFVFNGSDRLGGKTTEPGATVYEAGHTYPVATQEERDHIPIVPPSPTRLLARIGPLSGERLGLEILVGLLLGIPALLWGLTGGEDSSGGLETRLGPDADKIQALDLARRMRWATAGGLGLWMLAGIVLFSHMIRLHPRYVEGFTPAVAAMLGIGLAWAADVRRAGRAGYLRLALLLLVLALTVYYCERLLYGTPRDWWITLAGALGAGVCVVLARLGSVPERLRMVLAPGAVIAFSLVAVLTIPLQADFTAITDRVSDAGLVGQLPGSQQHPLSDYLIAHQEGAHYELAAESATAVGSLIVQDGRPVLMLTTYDARVFTSISRLKRLIAAGQVRYAFLNTFCTSQAQSVNPACSAPVKWVRAHAKDVSIKAGLTQGGLLYLLPGAKP
ncbi:MAG TPA: glycosyltransferase family 39 protein, partial [Solirubrobacteraceae bacterium]|nr:glycosyltransferase family 39 protein [Solirubrobacteraceae bacterium]